VGIYTGFRAIKFDGSFKNLNEIKGFGVIVSFRIKDENEWVESNPCDSLISFSETLEYIEIKTSKWVKPAWCGYKGVYIGDWIIKDINGFLNVCSPDFFEKTYEEV
jgi:hypothetical protein